MNILDKSVKGFRSYDLTNKQTPTQTNKQTSKHPYKQTNKQTNKQRIQLYISDQMKLKFLVLKGMNYPKKSIIYVVTSFK